MAADVKNSWWRKFKAWWSRWWLLTIPVTLAFTAIAVYICTFHDWPTDELPAAWGTFGDFLGGLLNPVVSTLTLFVAIQVWHLQRDDLKETKDALKNQANTAEANRREQRFFDLMQMYIQTLNTFQDNRGNHQKIGKESISIPTEFTATQFRDLKLTTTLQEFQIRALNKWKQDIKDKWGREFDKPQTYNHYFRTVFRILCDADSLLKEDRYRFIRIFRAQLSGSELFLLGLNLWASPEGEKMRLIASEYGLLKHLPAGDFRDLLEEELPPAVFGRKFAAERGEQSALSANPPSKAEAP